MTVATQVIRPMKAPTESVSDFEALHYPLLGSPKIDGQRCMGHAGRIWTSTMSPFPNVNLNKVMTGRWLDGLDGEIVVGLPNGENVLKRTKAVMAREGSPEFTWYVFDDYSRADLPFEQRFGNAARRVHEFTKGLRRICVVPLPQSILRSAKDAAEYELCCINSGYEGMMLRDPRAPYKFGRATLKEASIFKCKRWDDAEAVVVDLVQGSVNGNEAVRRGDGGIKRSTSKEGLMPSGAVGTLVCMDLSTRAEIRVATGTMTAAEAAHYWQEPRDIVGKIITYKYMPYGTDRLPRHPTFKCIRLDV